MSASWSVIPLLTSRLSKRLPVPLTGNWISKEGRIQAELCWDLGDAGTLKGLVQGYLPWGHQVLTTSAPERQLGSRPTVSKPGSRPLLQG